MAGKKTSFMPVVKADDEEELVDPHQALRDKCANEKHAQDVFANLQTCNDRVRSRSNTAETCEEEMMDWLHVVDHCVSKSLWSKLK